MKNSHFLGLFFTLFAITAASVGTFWAVFSGFSALDAIKEKNISEGTVLIIDPGHGGADGGAVSVTGKYEKGVGHKKEGGAGKLPGGRILFEHPPK